jgi:DNA-binding IclR family transcriptional regulator
MDNLLRDVAELLDLIDSSLNDYHKSLEECDWADFDDKFRNIRRNISTFTLKIDEAIRWD